MSRKQKRRGRPPITLTRRIGGGVLAALVIVVALAFVAGLAIALVIGGPFLLVVDWFRKRMFLARHAGESFLVVRRKRGWRDFVVNNVEPALPERCVCLWQDGLGPLSDVKFFVRFRMKRPPGLRRPYLVVISLNRRLRVVPLHEALLPLKTKAKRNSDVQRAVGEVLHRAVASMSLHPRL